LQAPKNKKNNKETSLVVWQSRRKKAKARMSGRRVRAEGGALSTPAAPTPQENTEQDLARARREREEAWKRRQRDRDEKRSYDSEGWKTWIEKQENGVLNLNNMGLNNKVLRRLTEGLVLNAEASPDFVIKELRIGTSEIDDDAFLYFVVNLPEKYKSTLEVLDLSDNEGLEDITNLGVSIAGPFENMRELNLSKCTLHGKFPVVQMQNLEVLKLDFNPFAPGEKRPPINFSEEALRSLPPSCKIFFKLTRIQVTRDDLEVVLLRERDEEPVTVREICEEAQIGCGTTMIKPARTRSKCETCFSPRPLYLCAGCTQTFYCGKKCQKEHWSEHELKCGVGGKNNKN
jgi:hypothetical protein